MKQNTIRYLLAFVVVLIVAWLMWSSWVTSHENIMAAIIQVIGLLLVGLLANKWLADYNERKVARLERYKLQRHICENLPGLILNSVSHALEYGAAHFKEAHSYEIMGISKASDPEPENCLRILEDEIYAILGQTALCSAAFKSEQLKEDLQIVATVLLKFGKTARDIAPNYKPTAASIMKYTEALTRNLKPIYNRMDRITNTLVEELQDWIAPKKI